MREVRPLKSQLILAEAHAAKPVPLVPARKKQPIKADALLEQLQRDVDGQKAGRTSFGEKLAHLFQCVCLLVKHLVFEHPELSNEYEGPGALSHTRIKQCEKEN